MAEPDPGPPGLPPQLVEAWRRLVARVGMRRMALGIAAVALAGISAVNISLIVAAASGDAAPAASAVPDPGAPAASGAPVASGEPVASGASSAPVAPGAPTPAGSQLQPHPVTDHVTALLGAMRAAAEAAEDDAPENPAAGAEPAPRRRPGTVKQAVNAGCNTSTVDALSRQIIAQARCIDADAFVKVPARPNLEVGSNVFLYMHATARDRLLSVLDAHPDKKLKVNSALRTVAQQYLLWNWSKKKRCGVQLATPPGESNHETGLALDIAQAPRWRPILESNGFKWLGAIDKVHFDFEGVKGGARNVDVLAFQQLWNRANPDDTIEETGKYSPETEKRLEKSPAGGFAVPAQCERPLGAGG